MQSIGDRIRTARRKVPGMTQAKIARALGISRPSVTQWETNVTTPDTERIDELARLLHVSTDWLLGGPNATGQAPEMTPVTGGLPVTGYVEAGRYFDIDDDQSVPNDLEVPLIAGYDPAHLRALMVSGNSINRVARPGEVLICLDHIATGSEVGQNDLVIVERSRFGGQMVERTAKRLRRAASGAWELWPDSDDPAYQTPTVLTDAADHEEIRIAAKVVWIIRKP